MTPSGLGAASFVPGVLRWIWDLVLGVWYHLGSTSPIPHWALYIMALSCLPTFVIAGRKLLKKAGPDITSYTEDSFFGVKWRWRYFANAPFDPWAFCPRCDTMLVYSHEGGHFSRETALTCETCGRVMLRQEGDNEYLVAKVQRQIDRKLRTGEWQTANQRDA